MIEKRENTIDDLVRYVTLHNRKPLMLNGCILPFVFLYGLAGYIINSYGSNNPEKTNTFEIGMIIISVVAAIQLIVSLCCFWNVHINTFLSYNKVSLYVASLFYRILIRKFLSGKNCANSKVC